MSVTSLPEMSSIEQLERVIALIAKMDDFYCDNKQYRSPVHYLLKNHFQLLFVLEQKKWPLPYRVFLDVDSKITQEHSKRCYSLYALENPFDDKFGPLSHPYFGYAIYLNKIEECAFFVHSDGSYFAEKHHEVVIDPLRVRSGGVQPFCYIGCAVEKEYIISYLESSGCSPLQLHVAAKNENNGK